MLVYVLNNKNNPLMPCSPCKARKLLKRGLAKVIKRTPFTIQLLYGSSGYKQPIILGVDTGSKIIGLSATTSTKEVFSGEVILRNDITELLSSRREYRKRRKQLSTRYRKQRVLNRKNSKTKGWLSPSIKNKIHTHLKIIGDIYTILPITKIIVEGASFDIQKMKDPQIHNEQYQQGEQLNFLNVREYVLWRDFHQCCGKVNCQNKVLNVHHIESRKTGGDSPNNLITLCEKCHEEYHKGKLKLHFKRGTVFKDATFMSIMNQRLYDKLKTLYCDVSLTYGYITKNIRTIHNLPKQHRIDALCITGVPTAKRIDSWFYIKSVRKHNRQIHRAKILKGGTRKLNQSAYNLYGFRLFDKVKYKNIECFIFGRRLKGFFNVKLLDGTLINTDASYKKLKLLEKRKSLLIQQRRI